MSKEQENTSKYRRWVLEYMNNIREATESDKIDYDLDESATCPDAPPTSVQRAIIYHLEDEGVIGVLDTKEGPARDGRIAIEISGFRIKILPKFHELFKNYAESTNLLLQIRPGDSAKPEVSTGGLAFFSDGTVRFKGRIIPMRNQLSILCKIFIENTGQLASMDTIREEIIRHDRRASTSFDTISKYVSELHVLLKIHFKKKIIFNQKKIGWIFKP